MSFYSPEKQLDLLIQLFWGGLKTDMGWERETAEEKV